MMADIQRPSRATAIKGSSCGPMLNKPEARQAAAHRRAQQRSSQELAQVLAAASAQAAAVCGGIEPVDGKLPKLGW